MTGLSLEAAFCFVCNLTTEHIVRRDKNGEIKSLTCRTCKHKHVVSHREL